MTPARPHGPSKGRTRQHRRALIACALGSLTIGATALLQRDAQLTAVTPPSSGTSASSAAATSGNATTNAVQARAAAAAVPAAPTTHLALSVITSRNSLAAIPSPRKDDAVPTYKWLIQDDTTGNPEGGQDDKRCHPSTNPLFPDSSPATFSDGTTNGNPGTACPWPSIHVMGSSPVISTGTQADWAAALTLPAYDPNTGRGLKNGRYLVSVMAPGYELGGAHFTVPFAADDNVAGHTGTVKVALNPYPIPLATVRLRVCADMTPVSGTCDIDTETGLAGFHATLSDVDGVVTADYYGNPLCTQYQTDTATGLILLSDGSQVNPNNDQPVDKGKPIPVPSGTQTPNSVAQCVSDSGGNIVIPNMPPNHYSARATSPYGQVWAQTTTLEGNHDFDVWVMPNDTGYDTEMVVGGEPVPFIEFGFVKPVGVQPADIPLVPAAGAAPQTHGSDGVGAVNAPFTSAGATTFTATTATATGLTPGWTTDQWVGFQVTAGTQVASVIGNTADTLRLAAPGWPGGAPASNTPFTMVIPTGAIKGQVYGWTAYLPGLGALPGTGNSAGVSGNKLEKPIKNAWVALNSLQNADHIAYGAAAKADDGNFTIKAVPDGDYSLAVWDYNQNYLLDVFNVTVKNGQMVDLGILPLNNWWTHISGKVCVDENGNGRCDPGEKGIPDILVQNLMRNNNAVDGGINTATTNDAGEYDLTQGYPLGQFVVEQVYNQRFKTIGITYQSCNDPQEHVLQTPAVDISYLATFGLCARIDWALKPYAPSSDPAAGFDNGGIVAEVVNDTVQTSHTGRQAIALDHMVGVPGVQMDLYTPIPDPTAPYEAKGRNGAGTTTSFTATTATDSTALWTPNKWKGYQVKAGDNTGVVVSNTATVLTLGGLGWSGGAPNAGSAFTVHNDGYVLCTHVNPTGIDCPQNDNSFAVWTDKNHTALKSIDHTLTGTPGRLAPARTGVSPTPDQAYVSEHYGRPTGCAPLDGNGNPFTQAVQDVAAYPGGPAWNNGTQGCIEAALTGVGINGGTDNAPVYYTTPGGTIVPANDAAPLDNPNSPNPGYQIAVDSTGAQQLHGIQTVDGNYALAPSGPGDYLAHVEVPGDKVLPQTTDESGVAVDRPLYHVTTEADRNDSNGMFMVPQGAKLDNIVWNNPPGTARQDPTGNYPESTSTQSSGPDAKCAGPTWTVHMDNAAQAASGGSPFENTLRALCDTKLIHVQNGQSVAPNFHLMTDVPIATKFSGLILDDASLDTNKKSSGLGDVNPIPGAPIGVYDWAQRQLTTTTSDYNGVWEVLMPSSIMFNCPTPAGVCPNLYRFVGNDPGQPSSPNFNYLPQYRTISAAFQAWPGQMVPADVAPTIATYTGNVAPGQQYATPANAICMPPYTAGSATNVPQLFTVDKPYTTGGSLTTSTTFKAGTAYTGSGATLYTSTFGTLYTEPAGPAYNSNGNTTSRTYSTNGVTVSPVQSWATNQWAGATITTTGILGGLLGGSAVIASNTATTITLVGGWGLLPPFGSPQFTIARNAYTSTSVRQYPSPGWAPGQWVGATVTTGGLFPQSRVIAASTADTLTVAPAWTPPGNTVTYTISGGPTYSTNGVTVGPSPNWTANQWVGATVMATNGTTTRTGVVASNTPNAITLTGPWTGGTPPANATFTIPANFYTANSVKVFPNPNWGANRWQGAAISAGTHNGTIASSTADTITLVANWTGGAPTNIPNTTFTIASNTYTATGVTVVPSPGWTANQWAGATIVAGTHVGTVASNTDRTITLTAAGWSGGTPTNATDFTITTPAADQVVITGLGFGTAQGTVTFSPPGGGTLTPTAWGDRSITAIVPASVPGGAYQLSVTTAAGMPARSGITYHVLRGNYKPHLVIVGPGPVPTPAAYPDTATATSIQAGLENAAAAGNSLVVVFPNAGTPVTIPSYNSTGNPIMPTYLTDPAAQWSTNQWSGFALVAGTSTATILSNTTNTLQLDGGWTGGQPANNTAYTIHQIQTPSNFTPLTAYYENVVIHSAVKLQGTGPGGIYPPDALTGQSQAVSGTVIDGRYFFSGEVPTGATGMVQTTWQNLVGSLQFGGPQAVPEAAVITVVGRQGQYGSAFAPAVDGFRIQGGDDQNVAGNEQTVSFQKPTPNYTPFETQGGAIYLHAYADNFRITNNLVQGNTGSYGSIRIGAPQGGPGGIPATSSQPNANVLIDHNSIVANGGTNFAGAVGLFAGSDAYAVTHNFLCGNHSSEYGGGVSHFGYSNGGDISYNTVALNESLDEGGGIMVAGETPPAGQTSPGAAPKTATVKVTHNYISGNLAGDDGGGVRLLSAGLAKFLISDNVITNNLSAHEGGGISIDNAAYVTIVNDTIAKNLTTATAASSDGSPAPAGISTGLNSAWLLKLAQDQSVTGVGSFTPPLIDNAVLWDNRAGSWSPSKGVLGIGLNGTADINLWDAGSADGAGTVSPKYSILNSTQGISASANPGTNKINTDPLFAGPFDDHVTVTAQRTFFRFRPAAVITIDLPANLIGDYSLKPGSPALQAGASQTTLGDGAPVPTANIDDAPWPGGPTPNMGAK